MIFIWKHYAGKKILALPTYRLSPSRSSESCHVSGVICHFLGVILVRYKAGHTFTRCKTTQQLQSWSPFDFGYNWAFSMTFGLSTLMKDGGNFSFSWLCNICLMHSPLSPRDNLFASISGFWVTCVHNSANKIWSGGLRTSFQNKQVGICFMTHPIWGLPKQELYGHD